MIKIKGSKDGTLLKARFEGKAKSLFPNLKKTKALVLLSIKGNPYCAGEYLSEIVKKAVKEFEFTTFLIADEVYWHNLCRSSEDSTYNKERLKSEAVLLGKAYFEDHLACFLNPLGLNTSEFDAHLVEQFPLDKQLALNKSATDYEVLYWRDWINQSEQYTTLEPEISALYHSHPLLAESVKVVASDYVRRHATASVPEEVLLHSSLNYLIEESPAVMWIAASLGYQFIIYPGEMIPSFAATRDYFIKNGTNNHPLLIDAKKPELLVNWLEVCFIRSRASDSDSMRTSTGCDSVKQNALSQMIQGVTQGIFNLALDEKEKISLLTDILIEYQQKKGV